MDSRFVASSSACYSRADEHTKLFICSTGKPHEYHAYLHEKCGDIVRTGGLFPSPAPFVVLKRVVERGQVDLSEMFGFHVSLVFCALGHHVDCFSIRFDLMKDPSKPGEVNFWFSLATTPLP